jgi:hypothetical protein
MMGIDPILGDHRRNQMSNRGMWRKNTLEGSSIIQLSEDCIK